MLRSWRALLALAALIAVGLLWVLGKTDVIIAMVFGALVLLSGRAVFRSYSVTKGPTGPAVDVEERGKLLVYACETCGEQVVLLRRGTDAPPRHCSETMVLRQVDVPDRELN